MGHFYAYAHLVTSGDIDKSPTETRANSKGLNRNLQPRLDLSHQSHAKNHQLSAKKTAEF